MRVFLLNKALKYIKTYCKTQDGCEECIFNMCRGRTRTSTCFINTPPYYCLSATDYIELNNKAKEQKYG